MELAQLSYLGRQHGLAIALRGLVDGIQKVMQDTVVRPTEADRRYLNQRFRDALERDWKNAEEGFYPRSLLLELEALKALTRALPSLIKEFPKVARRIRARKTDDLPRDLDRSRYPSYYLRNFHWQSDGWFSKRSARLYDPTVDLLFGGAADVMRRMVLPAVVTATRAMKSPRILDVACGTGRFLRQLRAAVPQASITGLDLSPHYIAHARQLLRDEGDLSLIVDNAEHMPFRDASFDAVTSVFLFHEMPRDARRRVMREIARVLVPGGTVSICDSSQLIESEPLSVFLGGFQAAYHEPYYKGYIDDPLEEIVQEEGLVLKSSEPCIVSKTVVAEKPL